MQDIKLNLKQIVCNINCTYSNHEYTTFRKENKTNTTHVPKMYKSHTYSVFNMNNELHLSKVEFILGSHQMKPCINITFMIAKLHIFSCISSIQKCITIWRDFIILLVENPTRSSTWIWASHRLSSSVFPLCMFLFKYYMYFVFFVCIF